MSRCPRKIVEVVSRVGGAESFRTAELGMNAFVTAAMIVIIMSERIVLVVLSTKGIKRELISTKEACKNAKILNTFICHALVHSFPNASVYRFVQCIHSTKGLRSAE